MLKVSNSIFADHSLPVHGPLEWEVTSGVINAFKVFIEDISPFGGDGVGKFGAGAQAKLADPAAAPLSATTVPQAQQMQPAELASMLKSAGTPRPLVLQVGSHVMFAQAHIPGSVYAGPGSQAAGLQSLEKAVASTAKGKLIVIDCGCCPWNRCPNVGPA